MSRNATIAAVCITLLLACIAGGNLFCKLDNMDIVSWDEARHGVSAFEMLESGNYVVNTYDGSPDYYNLKPPLAFATMMAGFSLFGANVFGLRVFSSIATLLTIVIIMYACKKNGNYFVSLIAAAVLITSRTFIAHHNARSGDADALFILFYTAAVCILLARSDSPHRYAAACFLASLAFLTKSFHAGPVCLTIAVFFFMDHTISRNTLFRGFVSFLCFLAPILIWALMRYQNDGMAFFKEMFVYDMVSRLSTPLEGHEGDASFTIDFILSDFKTWMIFLAGACAVAFIPLRSDTKIAMTDKRVRMKLVLAAALPIILFTLSSTKLRWYAYTAYPFIAMLMAFCLEYCFRRKRQAPLFAAAVCGLVLAAFVLSEARTARAIDSRIKRFEDPVQHTMAEISRQHEGMVHLFLEPDGWEQSHLLAAKFAGNLVLEKGGAAAYTTFAGQKALVPKVEIRQ